MATKNNPLDAFASPVPASAFKLPELPNLGQLISASDFKTGHDRYHQEMTVWAQRLEQMLNERFAAKAPVPTGKVE